jgi:hypothetical protein
VIAPRLRLSVLADADAPAAEAAPHSRSSAAARRMHRRVYMRVVELRDERREHCPHTVVDARAGAMDRERVDKSACWTHLGKADVGDRGTGEKTS